MVKLTTLMYGGCYIFFYLIGRLPRPHMILLANILGRIWFIVDERHKTVALKNLERAFGDELNRLEIRNLAKDVFKNLAQIIFELGWSLHITPREFSRYFRIEGVDQYINARKQHKGVLFLTAHLGNWELLAIIVNMIGITANVVYRPLDFTPMDLVFKKMRTRLGSKLIPRTRAMLNIFKCLKKGEDVGVLLDQSIGRKKGVFVDFFDQPTCTNKGLAQIALKTGSPVVPIFLIREPWGFRAKFGPKIPLIKTGDMDQNIAANTQQYNRAIEAAIRRHPEQWFWVHRRWKVKPSKN